MTAHGKIMRQRCPGRSRMKIAGKPQEGWSKCRHGKIIKVRFWVKIAGEC